MALPVFKTGRPAGRAGGGWVRFPRASAICPVVPVPAGPDIPPVSVSPTTDRPGSSTASYALAGLVAAALFTSWLIRSFHESTPRLPGLPAPFDSLLFAGALLAGLAVLWARREGRDRFTSLRAPHRLTLPQVLPLVFVLLLEKWVTGPVLEPILDRLVAAFPDPRLADAAFRGLSALGLLAVGLFGAFVLRQSWARIHAVMRPGRLPAAFLLLAASVAGTGLVAWSAALLAGAPWGWLPRPPALLATVTLAQVARGLAEETWYRGIVQVTVIRLLLQAGFPEGRAVRVTGILLVSGAFTLEHLAPARTLAAQQGELLWVLAMGTLLGTLLEVSRNLWLVAGVHALVNLLVALVLPLPITPDGAPVLPPGVLATILVFLAFAGVVASHRHRGYA